MKLYVTGIGAGSREGLTLQAQEAICRSDLVVGYTVYTAQVQQWFPDKPCLSTGMRQETDRVRLALEHAQSGKTVALVCSGDAAVYGMAGLALTLGADLPEVDIEIVPGVTAALSGSAVLGAPLTHDFAVISLSDLLTPMEKIERRLHCAAAGDLVIVLYNPSSKHRAGHLRRACDILLAHQAPETDCGIVRNIGRNGQESRLTTLAALRETETDMFTTVFIGNSETRVIGGRMVTPRGYHV